MSARCTKPEAKARVDWALEQLLAGRPRVTLVREAMAQWGLSEAQGQRIVRAGVEAILATYEQVERPETLARCIHALEQALELAVTRGQPQEICTTVKAMAGLLGLGADHSNHSTATTPRYGRSRH